MPLLVIDGGIPYHIFSHLLIKDVAVTPHPSAFLLAMIPYLRLLAPRESLKQIDSNDGNFSICKPHLESR